MYRYYNIQNSDIRYRSIPRRNSEYFACLFFPHEPNIQKVCEIFGFESEPCKMYDRNSPDVDNIDRRESYTSFLRSYYERTRNRNGKFLFLVRRKSKPTVKRKIITRVLPRKRIIMPGKKTVYIYLPIVSEQTGSGESYHYRPFVNRYIWKGKNTIKRYDAYYYYYYTG